MGVLAKAIGREELRIDPGWLTRDDDVDGGQSTPAGVRVTRASAMGMTTVWRCVDLLTSAIAQAPKDIIVKIGGKSFPEHTPPSWLSSPHPGDPNYTASDYFDELATSLLLDGNYFVNVFPHVLDPQMLIVLDPQLVKMNSATSFTVRDRNGAVIGTYDSMTMLHGWWRKLPGMLRGIAPLEILRRSIGGAIAAEEHASRFFGQGAALSFGVETPGTLDKAQRDELSASLKKRYAGLNNSHAIGLLTNGARFITGLAPTPEQAQMLATRQFSVEDLCRPFGVPPHMAGSQQPGAVSYASVEGTLLEFKQYAALPLAVRIEAGHNRLVTVPDNVTSVGATAQFKFNLDGIARADLLTRYQAYSSGILGGFLTPDEARTREDLPAKGGKADQLFMQMQMEPLGADDGPPIDKLIAQVNAGILTHDEAREALKRKPIEWSNDPSKDEIAALAQQVEAGLLSQDEARAKLKLPPMVWDTKPDTDELVKQLSSGMLTVDEAREVMGRTPMQWDEAMTHDEIGALIAQVESGLLTNDEARAKMGLGPMEWGEGLSHDEVGALIAEVEAGLITHEEARVKMGLGPAEWPEDMSHDEVGALIAKVEAGLMTHDEARAKMGLPPIEWGDEPSPENVDAMNKQITSGLLTLEEARDKLGRPPIEWPQEDNMAEKIEHLGGLIKAGFDPADALAVLGLPQIKHLGLPPVTVQKAADAEPITSAPDGVLDDTGLPVGAQP